MVGYLCYSFALEDFLMGPGSFDDFVQRENDAARRSQGDSIDWQAEKTTWLRLLADLYTRLEGYLKPYIEAGQISLTYRDTDVSEEYLGIYPAPLATITIGAKTVTLEPIGTIQTGSRGRIDVIGNLARAQLIMVESGTVAQLIPSTGIGRARHGIKRLSEARWTWKIVTRDTVDLTREAFLSLIVEVAKG
jgi:hypothetical protein